MTRHSFYSKHETSPRRNKTPKHFPGRLGSKALFSSTPPRPPHPHTKKIIIKPQVYYADRFSFLIFYLRLCLASVVVRAVKHPPGPAVLFTVQIFSRPGCYLHLSASKPSRCISAIRATCLSQRWWFCLAHSLYRGLRTAGPVSSNAHRSSF